MNSEQSFKKIACEQSTADFKCCDHRTSTLDEQKLSQILIDHCVPSFQSSLKLQALVVYQVDDQKVNSLLVDREYTQSSDLDSFAEHPDHSTQKNSLLSDSGFLEIAETSESSIKSDFVIDSPNSSSVPSSRRKRKLCKPCKLPVNGKPETIDADPISPSEPSAASVNLDSSDEPRSTQSMETSTTAVPVTATELVHVNPGGLPENVILPVSGVTLLPSLGVFSLPITVFSTLHRPILPRTSLEQLHVSQTVLPTPTPVFSNTAGSTTQPILIRKPEEPKDTPPNHLINNRRFGKSFVCNQCRKEFTSLNLLCAHTFSVHRGFRCTICRAQFTQRSNLQRHSLRHVGFKPFVCKICEKAYYRKDHLVRHIELAHPGSDPRVSLTVKLSSAECLEYLDKIQHNGLEAEQAQLLYQTPSVESVEVSPVASAPPVTTAANCATGSEVISDGGGMLNPTVLTSS